MKKTLAVVILLALVAASGSAQVGLGLTAAASAGLAALYDFSTFGPGDPLPVFVGATLKYKPSALVIDSGIGLWESGALVYGYLDLGLAVDLWIFRLGLCAGLDAVSLNSSYLAYYTGVTTYSALGFNAKLSLDVKIGNSTVGLSLDAPLDALVNAYRNGWNIGGAHDELRIMAAQVSLSFVYWFTAN